MKNADWDKVKRGDPVIYADVYKGVHKATVIEIDVAVIVTKPTYHKEHPYGLTADLGTVRIRYDTTETVANLANLIKYKSTTYAALMKAYNSYLFYKQEMEYHQEAFQALVNTEKAK